MTHGFLKVAATAIDLQIADPHGNAALVIERIREADKAGVRLLVFPELTLTGVTCGDLFFTDSLLSAAERALEAVADATEGTSTAAVVGLPVRYGGRVYNAAAFLCGGRIVGIVPKRHLGVGADAYEARYFASADTLTEHGYLTMNGLPVYFGRDQLFSADDPRFTFAIAIGNEDLTLPSPSADSVREGATIVANPTALPALMSSELPRRRDLLSLSARLACGYVSAAASPDESTQDMVFGDHHLIAENGTLLAEHSAFAEGALLITEIDTEGLLAARRNYPSFLPSSTYVVNRFSLPCQTTTLTRTYDTTPFVPKGCGCADASERALTIQAYGLKKRMQSAHAQTAVIGISGGLDSTLALLATVRAFDLIKKDRREIRAYTMPCFGTTSRTKSNARALCEALGVSLTSIDLTASVTRHFLDIGHDPNLTDHTYENAQARERTQVLMDEANRHNGLVIGTGDLSELALGWATYNGDHMSMYGLNASIPKTLVRSLVAYEAERLGGSVGAILADILDTPVSPELLPATAEGDIAQKTEDLVGPYELHDFFLYHFLSGASPKKIYRLARYAFDGTYGDDVILKWLRTFFRRFFTQQFKRSCLPDGPKVTPFSLSPRTDWRMPSDASAAAFLSEIDALS